jgi:hypothetical protein
MTHLQTPAKSAREALERLEGLSQAPSAATIGRAKFVISILHRIKSPEPFVFPTEIQGVQFEWHGSPRALDVEVLPEGTGLAYVTFENGVPKAEGEIGADVEMDIASLVQWLMSR